MSAKIYKSRAYQILCTVLFGLVLIGLPLTSFPPLRRVAGSLVAPFSAIPLAGIMLIWLAPYLLKRGKLPAEIVPIFYFAIFALLISAASFFLDGFYIRDRDFLDQTIRALMTLAIGLSFYITLTAYIRNQTILNQALLFLYITGGLLILWSILEIFLMQKYGTVGGFPEWVQRLKAALVFQQPGLSYTNRITAFAYEPSWYVLVFDLILFPIWLSSVFQRKSLLKWKLWIFQLEDLLLIIGLGVYVFSYPRIGLIALMVMLAYLGIRWVSRLYRKILTWLTSRPKHKLKETFLLKIILVLALMVFFSVVVISALAVFIIYASRQDARFQLIINQVTTGQLFDISFSETSIILLARRLAFYERTIFWFGGWNIFADYPFGVGLGNAGFYLVERMNSLGYGSFEIRNILYQATSLMNTKSLWVRLLSETGIIGFTLYITWFFMLWRSAGLIQKSEDKVMKILGLAGKLFLLASFVDGFSVDSFAIPYQWVGASLISAGRWIVQKEMTGENSPSTSVDEAEVAS